MGGGVPARTKIVASTASGSNAVQSGPVGPIGVSGSGVRTFVASPAPDIGADMGGVAQRGGTAARFDVEVCGSVRGALVHDSGGTVTKVV